MKALAILAAAVWSSTALGAACPALLDHKFRTVTGKEVDLCQYADRAVLVVNTAEVGVALGLGVS